MKDKRKEKAMPKLVKLAVAVAAWGVASSAVGKAWANPRYHYVNLDAAVPKGFAFFDAAEVIDDGKVFGTAYRCSPGGCLSYVAVKAGKVIKVFHQGFANDANNNGVVAGGVTTNTTSRQTSGQAALFRGSAVQRIPRLPGEFYSFAEQLTNTGIALIGSYDAGFNNFTPYLRRPSGAVTPLTPYNAFFLNVNDEGVVSGTTFVSDLGASRALRVRPPGTATLLEPLPTEPEAWGLGINSRGDVLGYSFVFGSTERIGFWRGTTFHTRFVEGTPEFPTVSNFLLWNDRGLIVVTATNDGNSYLVPAKDVRLNLADLVDRPLPPFTSIVGVNNRGDLVGFGAQQPFQTDESFLLVRDDEAAVAARVPYAPAAPAARAARRAAMAQGLLPAEALAAYSPAQRKDRPRE
jgi:hypothetical protein